MTAETIPPEAVGDLHDLADHLAEKARKGKDEHDRESWEYGQAVGFEKAAGELGSILNEYGIGGDDDVK